MPHSPPQPRPATPSITPTRILAADVLADLRGGALLDHAFERRTAGLEARDRRWLHELLWEMLRRRGWLDALLTERVRGGLARLDADVTDLLRLGAYQLLYMGSVPAYAAIGQTVELAKRRHGLGASKLANAVLRRIDRDRQDAADTGLAPMLPDDPIDALALRHSHPRWLVARWAERFGLVETARLLAANDAEAPVVVRPFGVTRDELVAALAGAGVGLADPGRDVTWARDSVQLASGTQLTALGAFRQGQFFVQDPASTLVVQYAAVPEGADVADVCTAPGGKALELSRTARAVYASDVSTSRLRRVVANVERLHADRVHVLAADARNPAVRPVDAVLVDAPCTGTGTFRRHPDARWRLKISDLAVMASLQRAVLRGAASIVRPGGLLVYSTCSLEPEENDAQVDAFLAEHPEFTPEPPPDGAVPAAVLDGDRLRVLPHRHGVDGAFAARLRRSDEVAA
ncbi:sun protein [Gemmatirosa kalamazoonensis]|uniref:16S rRNA (cytosine(967)-C(5))-methyltransferase n=1 Tax=Gemmatirosa kalamazoonensis TaxID=861299 RepID=W0RI49_9BACT|nr:16S rRNA (cytosine(967)-C(5))-methyltransferase RsmB [Gemmatirosa kalamazoonensis]AHG90102.1 sun protein [Gemmatirosa kalamazoonensis]